MQRYSTSSSITAQLLIVFIIAATVFLFLRTRDYLTVDGALRALQVYDVGKPFLHTNNHLLFPVNVYIWTTVLHSLGIRTDNPFAFLALVQAMNGVAASAFLTVLYGLCYKLTNRITVASLVTIGYGSSRAFLAHATNSAEPMVGLLWSGISVVLAVYGISRGKSWAFFAGGLLLSLAMATYQSMVLVGLPTVFLLWQWPVRRGDERGLRARIFPVMQFGAGFALGLPIIYGTAYWFSGTRTVAGMTERFLHVALSEFYGGVTPVKTLAVLPGLAYALFPCLPRECTGFRCLSEGQYRPWIPVAGLAVIVAGLSLTAMLGLAKRIWTNLTELEKVVIACCALGLIATMVPVVYWMPTYDKFWLQPLASLFLSSGILLNAALRADARMSSLRHLARWSCALVVAVGLSNLGRAKSLSAGPTPYLKEAQEVATLVRPKDLLVGDRDGIYLLYQYFWAARANTFNVPTDLEVNGPGTMARLSRAAAQAQDAGGEVFFLGLLDLSEGEWKALIGARGGPPYEQLGESRRCAEIIRSYRCGGRMVTLRRLGACAANVRGPGVPES